MSETNGVPHEALMVELEEVGGDPIVFEVELLEGGEHVAITLTRSESVTEDESDVRVRLVGRPEDFQHEIDMACDRPSRAPVVDPKVVQPFSAPFDVVTVAKRLEEIPRLSPNVDVGAMSRQLRGIRAMEEGRPAFDIECTVMVPKPGGERKGYRGRIRTIAGNEVTVTALRLTAELVADVMRKLDKGQVLR